MSQIPEQRDVHDVLLSHGWRPGGLVASGVRTYTHPDYDGQSIDVSPDGSAQHHGPGRDGQPYAHRTATPADLARHLAGFHDDRSIADLHLPGRKPE